MSASFTTEVFRESPATWQDEFLVLLPRIQRHVRFFRRNCPPHVREESFQEAVVGAMRAYVRLAAQGKRHVAYASVLARFAVLRIRSGRQSGIPQNSREVMSEACQRRHSYSLEREQDWRDGLYAS